MLRDTYTIDCHATGLVQINHDLGLGSSIEDVKLETVDAGLNAINEHTY
jgi:hypothetical protein